MPYGMQQTPVDFRRCLRKEVLGGLAIRYQPCAASAATSTIIMTFRALSTAVRQVCEVCGVGQVGTPLRAGHFDANDRMYTPAAPLTLKKQLSPAVLATFGLSRRAHWDVSEEAPQLLGGRRLTAKAHRNSTVVKELADEEEQKLAIKTKIKYHHELLNLLI